MPEGQSPEQPKPDRPEQQSTDATEASQGFVNRWKNELTIGIGAVMTAEQGFMAGVHAMQGNEKWAVLAGLTTAAFGALTAGKGIALARENRALRQQDSQSEKK